jgi:alkyl hydroperoxide reductase subunit D
MTQWVDQLKETIPDYAKDTKLNLDAVIKRSSLPVEEAEAIAVSAAFATGNSKFWTWVHSVIADRKEADAAITAASIMAQNNTWYPYVEMTNENERYCYSRRHNQGTI